MGWTENRDVQRSPTEAAMLAFVSHATIRYGTRQGRWVIAATVLGSGIAFLDSTVVNVALPAIEEELGGGLAGLQWVVDSYLLTLGALILLGGSLGDLYGRRRMFTYGLGAFAGASALCGFAPTIETLIAARALQGIAAALLVPASLAILQSVFIPDDRSTAIGAWSGLSGVTTALGPFIGGYLVDQVSWRLVFLINLPLAVATIWITNRHVPESRSHSARRPDIPGATAAAVGLAGLLYALIEGPTAGWTDAAVLGAAGIGILASIGFVLIESRTREPMLPLDLFSSRQFTGANLMTLFVYGAFGGALVLLVILLQTVMGYSALEAGAALIPVTLLLLVLSAPAGRLAQRIGPRLPMTLGPLTAAAGLALFVRVGPGSSFMPDVLPAVIVFGLGLALTVAPLTAAVLAAVDEDRSGIASGTNNAVARIAQLLAIALLPFLSGMTGTGEDPERFTAAFHTAVIYAAIGCAVGGVIAFATIRRLAPQEEP